MSSASSGDCSRRRLGIANAASEPTPTRAAPIHTAGVSPSTKVAPLPYDDRTVYCRSDEPGEFMVPVGRQQQIGVTYATVEKKPLKHSIRTVGLVAPDTQRKWDIVSRVDGYVQTLEISSRGQMVEKQKPVLTI